MGAASAREVVKALFSIVDNATVGLPGEMDFPVFGKPAVSINEGIQNGVNR
jgi:hypothetical protein